MLLTLVYLLLMGFVGLQFSVAILGVTAVLDVLGLLVLGAVMGVGQDNSGEDLTDYP